ncbi:MAG: hypothetical protein AB7G75_17725 [Candidatus Binatia bacterium]
MEEKRRTRLFSLFAVLFSVLAVSNSLKPLQLGGEQTGFVLLGERLSGTANLIAGPVFGLFLFVYAYGIWKRKRFAVPMGYAYATYVGINLVMFNIRTEIPPGVGYLIFGIVYSLIAVGISAGAAYFLTKQQAMLS